MQTIITTLAALGAGIIMIAVLSICIQITILSYDNGHYPITAFAAGLTLVLVGIILLSIGNVTGHSANNAPTRSGRSGMSEYGGKTSDGFRMSVDGGKTWINKEQACRLYPDRVGGYGYRNPDGTTTFISECGEVTTHEDFGATEATGRGGYNPDLAGPELGRIGHSNEEVVVVSGGGGGPDEKTITLQEAEKLLGKRIIIGMPGNNI